MNMGIGPLGAPNVIIKRKFRWTIEITTPCGYIPPYACKTSARPNIEIDETELHFLNGVTWLPGKAKWQPIQVTYYDVAGDTGFQSVMNWLCTLYEFQNPVMLRQSEKAGWAGTALLTMYDGCGTPLEFWLLGSVFPQQVNFGELDYSQGEFCTVELSLRYSDVQYLGACGGQFIPQSCCAGC